MNVNILPKLYLIFCCHQQKIQNMSHFWHFDYHNLETTLPNLIVGEGYNTKFFKIDITHFHLWTTHQTKIFTEILICPRLYEEVYPFLSLFIPYGFVYLRVLHLLFIFSLSFLHNKEDPFLIGFFLFLFFFFSVLTWFPSLYKYDWNIFWKVDFFSWTHFRFVREVKKLTFFYYYVNGLSL